MNYASHTPIKGVPRATCKVGDNVDFFKSANEALMFVLSELYKVGGDRFMIALAESVKKTEKRNQIARTKADVYPVVSSLDHQVREFVPGWWVGLNCNNDQKDQWVATACSLLGKTYGRGHDVWVRWSSPNLPPGTGRVSSSGSPLDE